MLLAGPGAGTDGREGVERVRLTHNRWVRLRPWPVLALPCRWPVGSVLAWGRLIC